MENIFLPSKIELKTDTNPNEGILTVEPLYHGYGTTIGNTLRRVLLSSLPGAAVTAVKIKGVQHEFSAIEGVHEDTLELILNLKQLRLKMYSDEPVILKLTKKGEGAVTGKDITKDSNVDIINTDLVIATITEKNKELDMEITVEKGRGFVATENKEKDKYSVGTIAIDAFYSPIKDVGFKVENTRVGQITNYDKLIVNFETDGTISPEEALNDAAKILIDHFSLLYNDKLAQVKAETSEVEEAAETESEEKKTKTTKKTTKAKKAKK